jgi:LPXTG-motif cell wall-anchored protein
MTGDMPTWFQILGIILASILAFYLMFKQAKEVEEMQKRIHSRVKRVTIIQCGDSKRIERPFKEGDFVGKEVECDTTRGVITGIYAEVEEAKRKSKAFSVSF